MITFYHNLFLFPPHLALSFALSLILPFAFYPMLFSMSFYAMINFIGHRNECSFHSIYFLNGCSTHLIRIPALPGFLFCHFSDLDYINFDEHVYFVNCFHSVISIFICSFVDVVIVVTLTFHFGTTNRK